jgi:murein DD-endopeptidase MepM/ murein hydrolase activator NlpD
VIGRFAVLTAAAAAILAAPLTLVMLVTPGRVAAESPAACAPADGVTIEGLDQEQNRNAAIIVAVGQAAGVPAYGLQIALATAVQESSLRNLDYGDRDSLGLFQQRPSTGWGTPAQVTDPVYAVRAFYGGPTGPNNGEPPGLLDIDGWQHMALTDAAQAVQRSANPQAYARWEAPAGRWLANLSGSLPGVCAKNAWVVPIRGDYTITARFDQTGPHWNTTHTGIDLAAPYGREVLAASAGQVSYADGDGRYGLRVEITHTNGTRTWYAHLSTIVVGLDLHVAPGDVIGQVGSTGNATGPHLHYEVRPPPGRPIDPEPWMAARGARL